MLSEQSLKLIDRESGLSNECPQRALRDFIVIRNHEATMGCGLLPENHMAAALPIEHIADLLERLHRFATGNDR